MTEREDALLAELVDGLCEGLPAEMGGRKVDAEFNGDGTAAVKRERRRGLAFSQTAV